MKPATWLMMAVLIASTSVFAASGDSKWQQPEEWASAFKEMGVSGTALIFDEGENRWLVHDRTRAEHAFSPASTFKVFNAMAALDSKAVADEHEVIRWDGKKRQYPIWNRDHSLASGMKYSAVWFYQEMARRIGRTRMQGYIDAVGYGNRDISGPIDQFWLNDTVRISAHQQIEFLRRLADGTLPFSQGAQDTVRRITIIEDSPHWILHAKTGWAMKGAADTKTDLGWVVGWLERNGRRWFYAINIDMPKSEDPATRLPLARRLLTDAGAFGSIE